MKKISIIILSLSMTACGGGSSESENSPPSGGNGGGTGGGNVATFPIKSNNLVRYEHGSYISYSGKIKFRGNSTYQPFEHSATLRETYSLSANPVVVSTEVGDQETLTKTSVTNVQTGEVITSSAEVIQFNDLPSVGNNLYAYRDGGEEACTFVQNDVCVGRLELPGNISTGVNFVAVGNESVWGLDIGLNGPKWNHKYEVTVSFNVEGKQVVTTPLGTFEAYVANFVLDKKDSDPFFTQTPFSVSGKHWIHPAIGIIKSEFTQKEGEFDIYDITYTLSSTNISY